MFETFGAQTFENSLFGMFVFNLVASHSRACARQVECFWSYMKSVDVKNLYTIVQVLFKNTD